MIRLPFAILGIASPLLVAAAPLSAQEQSAAPLPLDGWPWAAGVAVALAMLGLGALFWRRRKPAVMRLAAPAPEDGAAPDLASLNLTLEVTGASRSVMMFTLDYRLTITNRSARAANDLTLGVALACARRGLENGVSPTVARVERVGPHQSRIVTGKAQLPLSAIAPLRQGQLPLFIPLVHVTLEAEGQRARTSSFVIGTPSTAGRVHPIPLDTPPGAIPDLTAQAVAIPPAPAATA